MPFLEKSCGNAFPGPSAGRLIDQSSDHGNVIARHQSIDENSGLVFLAAEKTKDVMVRCRKDAGHEGLVAP